MVTYEDGDDDDIGEFSVGNVWKTGTDTLTHKIGAKKRYQIHTIPNYTIFELWCTACERPRARDRMRKWS